MPIQFPHNITRYLSGSWETWIKTILVLILAIVLYRQIVNREDAGLLLDTFRQQTGKAGVRWLWFTIALMPVNWILETLKWRNFMPAAGKPLFGYSFRAVLAGISVSLLTPNRSGEYLGRILMAQQDGRWPAVTAALAGSYCQLLVLLGAGLPSLALFTGYWSRLPGLPVQAVGIAAGLALAVMAFAGVFIQKFFRIVKNSKGGQKLAPWIKKLEALQQFERKQVLNGMALAALRYGVYSLQYYGMLRFAGIELPFLEAMAGVGTIFLIQTSLPLPPVANFLARGEIALLVWQTWKANAISVLASTYGLFVINLAFPALVGLFFILRLRIKNIRQ